MMADGSKENRPPPKLLFRYPEVRISDFFCHKLVSAILVMSVPRCVV